MCHHFLLYFEHFTIGTYVILIMGSGRTDKCQFQVTKHQGVMLLSQLDSDFHNRGSADTIVSTQ